MKKIILLGTVLIVGFSTVQAQSFKEKMAAKMTAKKENGNNQKKLKYVEPFEGDFSDASGISGAYYTTSELKADNGKNVQIVKIDYNGKDKLTFHLSKDETDPSVFWISDFHLYARDNYGHYEFNFKRTLDLYSVEPGVLVVGAAKRSGDGFVADETKFKPVVLVEDEAMIGKYTYKDAKRLIAEGKTLQEKYNRERNSGATKMADVGDLTSNKELMSECWKTIEAALSKKSDWAGELSNYQMHYIYEKQWGKDPASKVYNPGTKSYDYTRKMISVLAVFKDPKKNELTYYSFTIVKPTEDAENNYKGFKFNSNSRKQLVSSKTVDAKKAEVAKFIK
jgi:hypothetical protein